LLVKANILYQKYRCVKLVLGNPIPAVHLFFKLVMLK
jgi:hypothetical protein